MNKPEEYTKVAENLVDILKKDGLSLEKLEELSTNNPLCIINNEDIID